MVYGLHGVAGETAVGLVTMVRKHAGALAPILPRLQVELHVQE